MSEDFGKFGKPKYINTQSAYINALFCSKRLLLSFPLQVLYKLVFVFNMGIGLQKI
jgi:hypothetical protein